VRGARPSRELVCEGVVNGALAPTRAWGETLGARYAEMATRPVPSTKVPSQNPEPRTQSPEPRAQSPHLRPVGLAVGMGPGPGLERELSVSSIRTVS
jgi:hypothetical protein